MPKLHNNLHNPTFSGWYRHPRPSNYFFFLKLYIEHTEYKVVAGEEAEWKASVQAWRILALCNKANALEDYMNYMSQSSQKKRHLFQLGEGGYGWMTTASDLAAFRLSMISPVEKYVNHSRTVASMRETGWEQQQQVRLRSDSTVWSEFAFGLVGYCFLCCKHFFPR